MENFYYTLTEDQLRFYEDQGYLIIRGFFSGPERQGLQQWAQEVHDLPRTGDVPYMPYEVSVMRKHRRRRGELITNAGSQR
jgi:hypothetical protein